MVTLELSIIALFVSVLIGIAVAYARLSPNPAVAGAAAAYVEFVRSIPLLLIMFFIYFGLPAFQVTLTERLSAVFALSLYSGAYMTEIFRAGILAIGRGQVEAGPVRGWIGLLLRHHQVHPHPVSAGRCPLRQQLLECPH